MGTQKGNKMGRQTTQKTGRQNENGKMTDKKKYRRTGRQKRKMMKRKRKRNTGRQKYGAWEDKKH